MLKVNKKDEPEFFSEFKRKKNPKHWDILNKPENLHIKPELKSYMLKNEQKIGDKSYCPYCEMILFFEDNDLKEDKKSHIEHIVIQYPFLFAVALFVMSIFLFSQAATVRTLYPLGIALGISPLALVAMFPAVNGYFFIPNYPTVVAAINFDRTGTTRIGRYVLNHSFQLPGFIATIVAIVVGFVLISILF